MTRRVKRKREETAGTVDIPRSPSSSNFLEGDSKGQSDMLSRVGEMIRNQNVSEFSINILLELE